MTPPFRGLSGLLPAPGGAAAAGDLEPSRDRAATGRRVDEHRARGGPGRERELDPCRGQDDHERHWRLGRLHAQRLPVHVLLSLDGEGRQKISLAVLNGSESEIAQMFEAVLALDAEPEMTKT